VDKQFVVFIQNFFKLYGKAILNNLSKCKSLLLDHAKGEYKKEIRLLLQALEINCHTTILKSNDLNFTRISLINQLKNEFFISEEVSTELINLLLFELKNYKPEYATPISKSKNESKQNLFENNNNKINHNRANIQELVNIISSKANQNELFDKNFQECLKTIYRPAFGEYQDSMYKNNLLCVYDKASSGIKATRISFRFLFVSGTIFVPERINGNPSFEILKIDDNSINTRSNITTACKPERFITSDFTKEIIISKLETITNYILQELKNVNSKLKIIDRFTVYDNYIYPKGFTSSTRISYKPDKNTPSSRNEYTDLFNYIDELISFLSEDEIIEFSSTKHCTNFNKLFNEDFDISSLRKKEMKDMFSSMGALLEKLPDEKIDEFAKSEHFDNYNKLFRDLGLV
jgi:hypothetical protein